MFITTTTTKKSCMFVVATEKKQLPTVQENLMYLKISNESITQQNTNIYYTARRRRFIIYSLDALSVWEFLSPQQTVASISREKDAPSHHRVSDRNRECKVLSSNVSYRL